jgi:multiple sugar transport system permease protein
MKKSRTAYSFSELRDAYLFNAPLILLTLAFVLLPVVGTLVTSLYQDVSFLQRKFILFDNYIRLFTDIQFWQAVRFTMLFVALSVALELVLGMLFALVLNEALPGRGLLRVAVLIPWAIPIAISARIWELIYNFQFGVFNYLAINLGGAGPVNWLGTSTGALAALVVSDVWKTTPFMTIILLAGLSTIPDDLYQQARVDGTTAFQRFFRITLPLVRPAMVVALLFRTVDAIRIFDLVYVLTGGGPGGSTTPLSLYAYKFYISGDFGYGSAVSVAVFLLAFLLAVLYMRAGRFGEAVS